jgi:hypothetical protein
MYTVLLRPLHRHSSVHLQSTTLAPAAHDRDDAERCAFAIERAYLWPLCMVPSNYKKSLEPHQFTWTQNIVSTLLNLCMTRGEGMLKQIYEECFNLSDLDLTTTLMLDCVKDVKQMDGIAGWSWRVLEPLFACMQELKDRSSTACGISEHYLIIIRPPPF